MVGDHFRKKLRDSAAPFDDAYLDSVDDNFAVAWLERNSDDPWLFHMMRDRKTGKPVFTEKAKQGAYPKEELPGIWFNDAEETYLAMRLMSSAAEASGRLFFGLTFHLAQQVIEKGAKAIVCLQDPSTNLKIKFGHDLSTIIDHIDAGMVSIDRKSRMKEVAEAFDIGKEVGKYKVETGGGFGMGLDWARPIDFYMKTVYNVFKPKLKDRLHSEIDAIADGRAVRFAIRPFAVKVEQIQYALFWNNPIFFHDWRGRCAKLESQGSS